MWGGGPGTEQFTAAQAAFIRDSRQYSIEIAVPRAALAWNDTGESTHRLDLAINDRDSGSRRETQLTWSGIDRNVFSSRYYGILRLPTQ
jgi:hypothetical protein